MPGKPTKPAARNTKLAARKVVRARQNPTTDELRHNEAQPAVEQAPPGGELAQPGSGLQRQVGNRVAGTLLKYAAPSNGNSQAVARKTDVIQRATFAELMAFWRTQELKEPPEKAQQIATKQAGNVSPDPANDKAAEEAKDSPGVSEETKDGGGSPALDKVQDEVKVASSPASKTISGSGSGGGRSDTHSGGGLRSEEAKSGGGGGGAANYNVALSGRFSQSLSESESGQRSGGEAKSGGGAANYNVALSGRFSQSLSESESGQQGGGEAKSGGGAANYNQPLSNRFSGSSPISATRSGSGTKYDTPVLGEAKSGSGGGGWSSMFSKTDSGSGSQAGTASGGSGAPAPNIYGNKTKVTYVDTAEAKKEFELNVGGSITQGGQPYDTSKMYSKFKGDGFGIYVMGRDGKFYSNSHKIGLFHHSSFLSGGDVAGAGEMKVTGGNLDWITNKSGHYFPGEAQLVQTLTMLQGASGFDTAKIGVFDNNMKWKDDLPGGAAQFLKDKAGLTGGGAGNKDTWKYDTKSMQGGHAGEETDSVSLVRQLIVSYVALAQAGRLKKFNKPNPAFGTDIADIKALVLAEFGWEQSDVDNYKEVLENWNNDKKIGEPPSPVSMGSMSPTSDSASLQSNVGSGEAKSGSGSGVSDGRDWDAELEELLKTNPNPDFSGLGFNMYAGRWELRSKDGSTSIMVTARHKVMLLKGEATLDELRPSDTSF